MATKGLLKDYVDPATGVTVGFWKIVGILIINENGQHETQIMVRGYLSETAFDNGNKPLIFIDFHSFSAKGLAGSENPLTPNTSEDVEEVCYSAIQNSNSNGYYTPIDFTIDVTVVTI